MKLKELFEVMNDNQCVDVYYKDSHGEQIKCASKNNLECIDEKYEEAEVVMITVTRYNTFDVIIEKPIVNKRYTVNFSIPSWIDLDYEVEIEFEDDEDENEIEERIKDEFDEWLDNKIDEIRGYADKEVTDVEEY